MTTQIKNGDRPRFFWGKRGLSPFFLVLLLALTALLYWPAVSGPFLLDDLPNLLPLQDAGGNFSWPALGMYLDSGWTGPSGRPIGLLTFYLNAQDWPADPWWFKLTNLGIHLVNGALVYALARRLTMIAGGRVRTVALLAAAMWLLHPLHVSTVMYVSQRTVELAALFSLLGVLGYLFGRELAQRRPWPGYAVMAVAVVGGTVLATYSKEIGALLPVYILVLELSVLRRASVPAGWWTAARWLMVVLPSLVLAAYLISKLGGFSAGYGAKAFTMGERLLTEARVLMDYARQLFLPWTTEANLFHDGYPLSRGWLTPMTTLPAAAALTVLFAVAWALRRRMPVISLAILWYFAGHAMESSVIPLELYFEHRNYLPAFGPLFALAYYLARIPGARSVGGLAVALLFIFIAGVQTHLHARDWGSEQRLAELWFERNPESVWAHQQLANFYAHQGQADRAQDILNIGEARNPDRLDIELMRLHNACRRGEITQAEIAELQQDAAISPDGRTVLDGLRQVFHDADSKRCPPLDLESIAVVLQAMIDNPHFAGPPYVQSKLYLWLAKSYNGRGDFETALALADRAQSLNRSSEVAVMAAYWAFNTGDADLTQQYIDRARAGLRKRRGRLDIRYEARLKALEQRLNGDRPQLNPQLNPK